MTTRDMGITIEQRDVTRTAETLIIPINVPARNPFLYWLGIKILMIGANIVSFSAREDRKAS